MYGHYTPGCPPRPVTYVYSRYADEADLIKRPRSASETPFPDCKRIGVRHSDYVINPDWVSEDLDAAAPFSGRTRRPWSYEYPGARHWPWDTIEKKLEASNMMTRQTKPNASLTLRDPPIYADDPQELLFPRMRFGVVPRREPFRPNGWGSNIPSDQWPLRFGPEWNYYYPRNYLHNLYNKEKQENIGADNHVVPSYAYSAQKMPIILPDETPREYQNFVNAGWLP